MATAMYHSSAHLHVRLLRDKGISWSIISVPGGARIVALKSNVLYSCTYTDNSGWCERAGGGSIWWWHGVPFDSKDGGVTVYIHLLTRWWSNFWNYELPNLPYFSYEYSEELAGTFHCSCSWIFWRTLHLHYPVNKVWALNHVMLEACLFSCMIPILHNFSLILNTSHGLY